MWPWKRKRRTRPSEDAELAFTAKLEALELRVAELEEERTTRAVEWEDWFSKFSALYARLNKRVQREEARAAENGAAHAPAAEAPMSIGAQRLLSLGR